MTGDGRLVDEQAELARLRSDGYTLQEIARHFGKSIYWVNSRLNPSYAARKLRRSGGGGAQPTVLTSEPMGINFDSVGTCAGRLRGNKAIPAPLMALMSEIYEAVDHRLYTLAAMGIRAALENVMKEKVGDHPFKLLVNQFEKAGYLAPRRASSLDVIIEAGHAAIHRGWQPNDEDISTLLDLTEALIETVYLHEGRIRSLDEKVPRRPKS